MNEERSFQAPDNPLLPEVLRVLRGLSAPITEHALLKCLEAAGGWPSPLADEANLALFQKHFLLMNALYRLQEQLWREESLWLTIGPLRIGFEAGDTARQALTEAGGDALRSYYLDWRQLETTDGAQVARLLAGFWRRLRTVDGRADALATLELEEGCEWSTIKQQYRRLAARSHPDRGGDRERFLEVRAAYETLRLYHARSEKE